MEIELIESLKGKKFNIWKQFIEKAGIQADPHISHTVLVWDDDKLIATGSRQDNILKCIAVDESRRGEDLTATVLTSLRQDAFKQGYRHLFLYTKPENKDMFTSLFFYAVAQTDKVLLMENRCEGIVEFLKGLPVKDADGVIGSIIMNANPFTLGHRYLIEKAASECNHLYVFVLSEDKSFFSSADRMEMVKLGTSDIANVTVLPTGPYLISSATFPTYFLKERDKATDIHCMLDIEIFVRYFVPRFSIRRRYVGTEPISPMTDMYNKALQNNLPKKGIELLEIHRIEKDSAPVSASRVRSLIEKGDIEAVRKLVPKTTFDYLTTHELLTGGQL